MYLLYICGDTRIKRICILVFKYAQYTFPYYIIHICVYETILKCLLLITVYIMHMLNVSSVRNLFAANFRWFSFQTVLLRGLDLAIKQAIHAFPDTGEKCKNLPIYDWKGLMCSIESEPTKSAAQFFYSFSLTNSKLRRA